MYESISYAELKNLPKEQKPNAWKELKTLYPTQKELAEKLGVSPAIVYNMISRYTKDESTDGKKVRKLKVVEEPKKTKIRSVKQETQIKQEQNDTVIETKPVIPEPPVVAENIKAEDETFSISIKKTITGEDAQFFLSGIGSTLMKNQKYAIEVKITEK